MGPVDIRMPESALEGLSVMIQQAVQELRLEKVQGTLTEKSPISWSAQEWSLC
jgi:hypothetical protein